jgi:hypothetical protein
MRLAAQAKMGYYPTPDSVTPLIAKYLKRQRDGLIRVLDPCAGEGTAIKLIGDRLKAETFGIELDLERGGKAKEILACGLMNGVVWDRDKCNPLLVKGVTKKEVKRSVHVEGDLEKHIETDQIKILIHAFDRKGEMFTIE